MGVGLGVIEVEILDVFIRTVSLTKERVKIDPKVLYSVLTVLNCPPERIWVIERAMEGFSATQSTLMRRMMEVGRVLCAA